MVGVTIGTTALIVVLSVFNGIDLLLQTSAGSFTSDIVISPAKGKFADFDTATFTRLRTMPEIAYYNRMVEENALAKYGDKLKPVTVKGVEEEYAEHTHFADNILQGEFSLKSGDVDQSVVGYGIAAELGIGLNFLTPLIFYYPNKEASSVNSALNTGYLYPSGLFSSQQEIDRKFVITGMQFAQELFRIGNKISKIEVKLKKPDAIQKVKEELQLIAGPDYKVEDKYEINRSFYAMMQSEKLAVFLILLFILLIASFNIIGSISMLILDKKEDLGIYKALGMPVGRIIAIFKTEGNLITLVGATAGFVIGIGICLLQERFGFIHLGDGSYLVEAYPVKLVFSDILLIMATVLCIGYTASYFPVRYLVRKLIKD